MAELLSWEFQGNYRIDYNFRGAAIYKSYGRSYGGEMVEMFRGKLGLGKARDWCKKRAEEAEDQIKQHAKRHGATLSKEAKEFLR